MVGQRDARNSHIHIGGNRARHQRSGDRRGFPDLPDRLLRYPVDAPANIELRREEGLLIDWTDGTRSFYPVALLRRLSPSADMKELREQIKKNPLTVLPSRAPSGPLQAVSAELVGNYAVKIVFSDGHSTGIYSWEYLRKIDPAADPNGNQRA